MTGIGNVMTKKKTGTFWPQVASSLVRETSKRTVTAQSGKWDDKGAWSAVCEVPREAADLNLRGGMNKRGLAQEWYTKAGRQATQSLQKINLQSTERK